MENLLHQKPYKIIHVDMDCFYAQVEMRDNPALQGLPVAIGGPSKTQGVLCTSNYEARKFGVRSAQSTFKAFELCPSLILIPPNFEKYKSVSAQVSAIYQQYSDKVQNVSLDEAYLDVTDSDAYGGSATMIAQAIKKDIVEKTQLTASAGVSFNKMLAKIASDWQKPDGLFVITPDKREAFMRDLPLSKISGVGKVSYAKYQSMGFNTCSDVTNQDLYTLIEKLGKKRAVELYRSCSGVCNSKVKSFRQRKSLGIERTYFEAINDDTVIDDQLEKLFEKYKERLVSLKQYHLDNREISHVFVKVRFKDFSTYTRDLLIDSGVSKKIIASRDIDQDSREKLRRSIFLLKETYRQPFRLLGIGIKFQDKAAEQMGFDWA